MLSPAKAPLVARLVVGGVVLGLAVGAVGVPPTALLVAEVAGDVDAGDLVPLPHPTTITATNATAAAAATRRGALMRPPNQSEASQLGRSEPRQGHRPGLLVAMVCPFRWAAAVQPQCEQPLSTT